MKVILKDGTYSSKELCKLCAYDYKNFDKRQSTLINKLSKVCTIEKNKIGNKVYWTLLGSNGIEFDSSKRKQYNIKEDEGSMSFLMKRSLLNTIATSCNFNEDNYCIKTFDNWLTSMALVEEFYPTEKKNITYKSKVHEDKDIVKRDFFSIENSALYNNFLSALNTLDKKDNLIKWYKVKIAVDMQEQTVFLNTNSVQLKKITSLENEICEKYGITNRSDLLYGNKKENIRANIKKLKKFDEEMSYELTCQFGYKYTYDAFQVILIKDINYIKENYLNDYDIDKIKNDIYELRKNCALKRQSKNKDKIQKSIDEKMKNGFNVQDIILMSETRLRQLQYKEEYYKIWDNFYKIYILGRSE